MASDRVLLVVTPTVSREDLSRAVSATELRGSVLKVVVPAVERSAVSYWFSDQGAIERAAEAAARAVEEIGAAAASTESAAGDSDPELAVRDALATFKPDRILVVHRSDHPGYREEKLDSRWLEARIDRTVDERLVEVG